ncbi:MAG: MATE family efflux transporter [Flavobacterium sp.]|uniref:MATE family efflux transporter n=1 Tax=Flavobacterium sp. TaxID=239 RepID=UPI0012055C47|nr:MATE family efflux transporter [Flavobacterium sp.]RZJ67117.1 MAG: MATE family efflux transporter [Flavobacterium sp.]
MSLTAYTKEFAYNMKLAYPVILGMIGHTLIGIVDKLMVGRLGSAELAAVSLGNSFIFIAMSVGIGFSTAITPIVAEADAAKEYGQVRSAFHHGLFLCTILGISMFAIIYFSKPLMQFMGQPDEVIVLARPYLDWVAFSLIPMIIYQAYKQFADGLSMTKFSMYAIVAANIVHVPLNFLLIYGVWIFPKMGIVGAAVGTVISRIIMVVFMHFMLTRQKQLTPYFHGFSFHEIKKSVIRKIVAIGFPSSMQMLFEVALFTSAVWICGNLGKTSQAANEIALSLATLTYMFATGLSVTAMVRVSNQKGFNDFKNLIVVARSVFLLTILVEAIFAIFFIVFHQYLPHFFLDMDNGLQTHDNVEVIAIASELLIIAALFQIFDGVQVAVLGALRGVQDVKIPMYITFLSYWMIGFPLSFYFGLYTDLGAFGVWIGLLGGLGSAALFLYLRFNKVTHKLLVENSRAAVNT